MLRIFRKYIALFLFPLILLAQRHTLQSISPSKDELTTIVSILTRDSLEGRATGSPGQWRAARYIASQFQKYSLLPSGEDHSYFQNFTVEKKQMHPRSTLTIVNADSQMTYLWEHDFVTPDIVTLDATAPVYYAGTLTQCLPQRCFDSLQQPFCFLLVDIDSLKYSFTPHSFIQRVREHYSSSVAGILIGFTPVHSILYDILVEQVSSYIQRKLSLPSVTTAQGTPVFFLAPSVTEVLLQQLSKKTDSNGTVQPVRLSTVSIHCWHEDTVFSTCNVIGVLPGMDSSLSQEYIVISAHHDHLGKVNDTLYYTGADDNASGTAVLLETARMLQQLPARRRSVLFVSFTGEENGLLGSTYFVTHPTVPLTNIVANINIDMVGRNDYSHSSSQYIYVIGSNKVCERFDSLIRATNEETIQYTLDYRYNDETNPAQLLWRSDHSAFLRFGIPSVFFFGGFHDDYHETTDTPEKLNYTKLEHITRLVSTLAQKLSQLESSLCITQQ